MKDFLRRSEVVDLRKMREKAMPSRPKEDGHLLDLRKFKRKKEQPKKEFFEKVKFFEKPKEEPGEFLDREEREKMANLDESRSNLSQDNSRNQKNDESGFLKEQKDDAWDLDWYKIQDGDDLSSIYKEDKESANELGKDVYWSKGGWGGKFQRKLASVKFLRINWKLHRAFAVFVIFCFVISSTLGGYAFYESGMQIKDDVFKKGEAAYGNFLNAKDAVAATDLSEAENQFLLAANNLKAAKEEVDLVGQGLVSLAGRIPVLSKVKSGQLLLSAGEKAALAAASLSKAMENAIGIEGEEILDGQKEGQSLTEVMIAAQPDLESAVGYCEDALKDLEGVKVEDLPKDIQESFVFFRDRLPLTVNSLRMVVDSSDLLLEVLGHRVPKKYLVLFQNNEELRGGGGFIGSFALVNVNQGKVKKIEVGDIYDPSGQFEENFPKKVIPPKPMQTISDYWEIQDANWFADFQESSEKVTWFFERAKSETPDGIIGITPDVIEDFLEITGPIKMDAYGIVVDSKNFRSLVQEEVEENYDKEENSPKKVIGDLTPILLEKIFQAERSDLLKVFSALSSNLKEKKIVLYFQDDNLEKKVSALGWGGRINHTNGDYLSVVNYNVGGGKTDGVIEEEIKHRSEIQEDGSIVNTVTITRKHKGGSTGKKWYDVDNNNYQKVFVPKGSQLILAEGFVKGERDFSRRDYEDEENLIVDQDLNKIEVRRADSLTGTDILEEGGKTVFGNWIVLRPGEMKVVSYKYKLPFKVDLGIRNEADVYSLLIQKQIGSKGSYFKKEIFWEDKSWKVEWEYPQSITVEEKAARWEGRLVTDKMLGLVWTD
jgi:hypothetical protein